MSVPTDIAEHVKELLFAFRERNHKKINDLATDWSYLFVKHKKIGVVNFDVWREVCEEVLDKLKELNPIHSEIIDRLYFKGDKPEELVRSMPKPSPTEPGKTIQRFVTLDALDYHRRAAVDHFVLAYWSLESPLKYEKEQGSIPTLSSLSVETSQQELPQTDIVLLPQRDPENEEIQTLPPSDLPSTTSSELEPPQPTPHIPPIEVSSPPFVPKSLPTFRKLWPILAIFCIVLAIGGSYYWFFAPAPPVCISTVSGMCDIPAGEFVRGSTTEEIRYFEDRCIEARAGERCNTEAFGDEFPPQTVTLAGFRIDQHEVTNQDFQRFADAQSYITTAEQRGTSFIWNDSRNPRGFDLTPGASWRQPGGPGTSIAGREKYPVAHISWEDAQAYCSWMGKRLPTEAEWEKAARGMEGWLFPWGNEWEQDDLSRGNYVHEEIAPPLAQVGSYPNGVSPFGIHDMLGNVSEWVADWYGERYYETEESLLNPQGPPTPEMNIRVQRGGSRATRGGYLHAAWRIAQILSEEIPQPETTQDTLGFRCAQDL